MKPERCLTKPVLLLISVLIGAGFGYGDSCPSNSMGTVVYRVPLGSCGVLCTCCDTECTNPAHFCKNNDVAKCLFVGTVLNATRNAASTVGCS
jgi:hypothetical protein